MIRARGLVKRYRRFTAVNGIDLHILPGEIYGFLGPNGAGKTSTIMMLLGISRPTAGEVSLFGETFTAARLDLRRRIGVVPEKHPRGVRQWMTAAEYLGMFADLFLDEPTSGPDPVGIKQTRDLLLSENRPGRAVFISSHQLSEMEKICHRVAIISRGRLLAEDSVAGLLSRISRGLVPLRIEVKSPSLEEAFITITQDTVAALAPREGT